MAFVMMLSWSRRIFLHFFLDARMENFLRGHVAARDTRVQPHSLDSYDQLTKSGEDDV